MYGAVTTQVEIDYKAECAAGDTVDCFGARLTEPSAAAANVNGTGAHQSGSAVYVSVLHCMCASPATCSASHCFLPCTAGVAAVPCGALALDDARALVPEP